MHEVRVKLFAGEAESDLEQARRRAALAPPAASFCWSDTDPNPAFLPSRELPFVGGWDASRLGKPEPVEQLVGETVRYTTVNELLLRWLLGLLVVIGGAGFGHGFGWW